jgi:hypothetical protein
MSDEIYNTIGTKNVLMHPGKSADDVPGLHINPQDAIVYSANGQSSIMISDDGVGIAGPLSIMSSPYEVRYAGMWKVNPLVISTLPSTVYTPVPWLKSSMPKPNKQIIQGIVMALSMLKG